MYFLEFEDVFEIATFGLPKHDDAQNWEIIEPEDSPQFLTRFWPGFVGLDENPTSGANLDFLFEYMSDTLRYVISYKLSFQH